MSASYSISAKLGDKLIAEDVLFTASHPGLTTINSGWTKTPAYAPISAVPLKVGLLDQFRKVAGSNSEEEILGYAEKLVAEKNRIFNDIKKIDLAKERQIAGYV